MLPVELLEHVKGNLQYEDRLHLQIAFHLPPPCLRPVNMRLDAPCDGRIVLPISEEKRYVVEKGEMVITTLQQKREDGSWADHHIHWDFWE